MFECLLFVHLQHFLICLICFVAGIIDLEAFVKKQRKFLGDVIAHIKEHPEVKGRHSVQTWLTGLKNSPGEAIYREIRKRLVLFIVFLELPRATSAYPQVWIPINQIPFSAMFHCENNDNYHYLDMLPQKPCNVCFSIELKSTIFFFFAYADTEIFQGQIENYFSMNWCSPVKRKLEIGWTVEHDLGEKMTNGPEL